jgi:hypothetical protein
MSEEERRYREYQSRLFEENQKVIEKQNFSYLDIFEKQARMHKKA